MKGACYIQLFFSSTDTFESIMNRLFNSLTSGLFLNSERKGKKDFSKHALCLIIKSISQVFRNYYLITYLYCLIFKVFYAHKQQKQGAMFSFDKLITKHFGSHA